MKVYRSDEIKNIALIGSSGSGKTTLLEAMLSEVGVLKRRGTVEAGTTASDYFPVEKEYGYSVFSTVCAVPWKDQKLNLIDCPGSDDFVGALVSSLHVTDAALMVVNAQYGVEVGLINQFRYTDKFNKPVIFTINQLDHENADFDGAVAQLQERYGSRVVVVQFPVKTGPDFHEVIDVLRMVMYRWKPEGGEPEVLPIPDELMDKAAEYQQILVEAAAENDEALMELFFEKDTLTEDEMREGISKGLLSRGMYPVFSVSATKSMGVRRTLEFLTNIVPSTSSTPALPTTDGTELKVGAEEPAALYFFKSNLEQHVGEVDFFKVVTGTIKEGDDLINLSRNGSKERISQLFVPQGQNRIKVTELQAGDIGATVKLKDIKVGDTLGAKGVEQTFAGVEYPAPKYRRAIRPEDEHDSEKMNEILLRMHSEDPTWIIEQSKELRQTIVHGQGEFHLRTLKWRIENNDKLNIVFDEPRIPYRETITKVARADYRHKKQSGGAGQFGEVHLIVEPYEEGKEIPATYKFGNQEFKINARETNVIDLDWGGKLVFVNSIVGGSIDARFLPAILKGIMGRIERGPLTGSYARDVRVIVYDGKMHPVDSNEVSFMIAGRNAFSEAFRNAGPKVLEPIYNVEVQVPADFMGDVMSDMQGRRGMIMGMDSRKGYEVLKARVPLKELSNYSTALSSLTGGRASFTMAFDKYELVPQDIQDQLIAANQEEEE
ncbi:MAG: elongation factor G [Porphyromonas sp.]|nr:elongation factor G [Porphyromonas sp.]